MAEVLGVVASGIAVVDAAGQIGSGIMKLKKLWSEVKDVPETINSLMQQLELLTVVIGEMETIQQSSVGDAMRPFNSQGMQLSMMRCREAMDTLDHLVSKLAMHVDSEKRSKRARAKLKVALSKDNLAQCHERLKDTVQLLQFAQGCYQMSISGAVLQRLIALPTESEHNQEQELVEVNPSETEDHDTSDLPMVISKPKRSWIRSWHDIKRRFGPFATYAWDSCESKDELGFTQQGYYIRLELAQWLSGKSWEIQVTRAMSGWHHHLRTYNIVPEDSEVIRCAEAGNLDRIKYLFQNNLASIHDRDPDGRNLLWLSIPWEDDVHEPASDTQYKLAEFLVTCGLDIAESPGPEKFSPLQICLFEKTWSAHLPWLLTCWQSSEAAANADVVDVWTFINDIECTTCSTFEIFQPALQPDFYSLPLLERTRTCLSRVTDAKLFRRILHQDGVIRKEYITELASSNVSLLSVAMRAMHHYWRDFHDPVEGDRLLRELILLTNDHSMYSKDFKFNNKTGTEDSVSQGTALWVRVYTTQNERHRRGWRFNETPEESIQEHVFDWLKILQECNVDLLSYGQREHEIIFGGVRKRHEIRVRNEGSWMWTGFLWGPDPEDWTIHLDRVVERFVGDFWHLVDTPDLHVPGAWVDDDTCAPWWYDKFSEIDSDESEPEIEGESED
ncbi:hypothetical protein BJ166DRAFT_536707 [Pestalotiopsis sp. NC0098]|nr:hypothetical protein BJ166DRAFT_536707 [Pestalotiopsis sp. NC0098]